jgi:hypothetical protein
MLVRQVPNNGAREVPPAMPLLRSYRWSRVSTWAGTTHARHGRVYTRTGAETFALTAPHCHDCFAVESNFDNNETAPEMLVKQLKSIAFNPSLLA